MIQQEIEFPTDSPINGGKLSGQNKRVYEILQRGGKYHCLSPEIIEAGIGRLNSRISELFNKFDVPIKREMIQIKGMTLKQYWIE